MINQSDGVPNQRWEILGMIDEQISRSEGGLGLVLPGLFLVQGSAAVTDEPSLVRVSALSWSRVLHAPLLVRFLLHRSSSIQRLMPATPSMGSTMMCVRLSR
uniref:Uncharacterized protein n=1 Tax=Arundo donax TaxID=35708 RepID=A0A0A8YG51_ARUDO